MDGAAGVFGGDLAAEAVVAVKSGVAGGGGGFFEQAVDGDGAASLRRGGGSGDVEDGLVVAVDKGAGGGGVAEVVDGVGFGGEARRQHPTLTFDIRHRIFNIPANIQIEYSTWTFRIRAGGGRLAAAGHARSRAGGIKPPHDAVIGEGYT